MAGPSWPDWVPPWLTTPKGYVPVAAGALAVIVGLVFGIASLTGSASGDPVSGRNESQHNGDPSSPTATASSAPKKLNAAQRQRYCRAWADLTAKVPAHTPDEDAGVDLAQLGRTFAVLDDNYSAAQKRAPAGLVDDYAKVLGYLQSAEAAVRSRNVDQIKIMVTNLGTLNAFMAHIQSASHRLCG